MLGFAAIVALFMFLLIVLTYYLDSDFKLSIKEKRWDNFFWQRLAEALTGKLPFSLAINYIAMLALGLMFLFLILSNHYDKLS